MNIILLSAPGVGKGTLAAKIKEAYGIPQVSTGDLLRAEIASGTELGTQAKETVAAGKLVPDKVVAGLVKKRLQEKDASPGFILDGYPRTLQQAELLEEILKGLGKKIDIVLELFAEDKVIIERLSGRRICSKCQAVYHTKNILPKEEGICDKCGGQLYQRADDKPEVIKERLQVYEKQTAPLIAFYKKKKLLQRVDCNSTVETNFERVKKALSKIKK